MSFTVEYSDDGGSTFQTIQFASFDVEYGLSDVLLAPLAAVDASRQAGASTGDRLRIQENGSNIFTGRLTTGGEVRSDGQTRLQAEHDIYSVFADSVSITVSNPTDEDVYNAALSAATGGGSYTLNYVGTATSLADDYDVDDRKVKRIFKDMTDRTDRVFYVGVGDTITVAPRGNDGQFADLNAGDGFRVEKYNPGDIDTVRNAVTVNGTGGEQVSATETDSTSISDFGRRAKVYNFSYIRSAGEASSMASELLIPNPLADAELLLGRSISGTTDLQVNTTIDFDDPDGSGASDVLTVEKQTISPGATTVRLGEGAGVSIANVRRDNQSVEDTTEPGSVYNTDRIADNAVKSDKIVDSSITTSKINDFAVQLNKVANDAIDTVKIKDNAIEAPKILAGAITSNEIAAGTLTANEIDVLDLDTTDLSIATVSGDSSISFETLSFSSSPDAVRMNANSTGSQLDVRIGELSTDNYFGIANFGNVDIRDRVTHDPSAWGDTQDNQGNPIEGRAELTTFDPLDSGQNIAGLDATGWRVQPLSFSSSFPETTLVTALLDDGASIIPLTDGTGQLGGVSRGFADIYAKNITQQTPEPMSVDAADITDYDWRNPPLEVCQKKTADHEEIKYKRRNPKNGIDLGHMANYLFEVCKDQQSKIESLESTVDDLESRLADLEAKQE